MLKWICPRHGEIHFGNVIMRETHLVTFNNINLVVDSAETFEESEGDGLYYEEADEYSSDVFEFDHVECPDCGEISTWHET